VVIIGNDVRPSPVTIRARYHDLLCSLAVSPIFLSLLSSKSMLVDPLLASFVESSGFCYFNFLRKCIVDDSAFIGRNCCSSSRHGRGRN